MISSVLQLQSTATCSQENMVGVNILGDPYVIEHIFWTGLLDLKDCLTFSITNKSIRARFVGCDYWRVRIARALMNHRLLQHIFKETEISDGNLNSEAVQKRSDLISNFIEWRIQPLDSDALHVIERLFPHLTPLAMQQTANCVIAPLLRKHKGIVLSNYRSRRLVESCLKVVSVSFERIQELLGEILKNSLKNDFSFEDAAIILKWYEEQCDRYQIPRNYRAHLLIVEQLAENGEIDVALQFAETFKGTDTYRSAILCLADREARKKDPNARQKVYTLLSYIDSLEEYEEMKLAVLLSQNDSLDDFNKLLKRVIATLWNNHFLLQMAEYRAQWEDSDAIAAALRIGSHLEDFIWTPYRSECFQKIALIQATRNEENALQKSITIAKSINSSYFRRDTLRVLALMIYNKGGSGALDAALAVAETSDCALCDIARLVLDSGSVDNALTLSKKIGSEGFLIPLLQSIACARFKKMDEGALEEALKIAREIPGDVNVTKMFISIAQTKKPEKNAIDKAITIALSIPDLSMAQIRALVEISLSFPRSALPTPKDPLRVITEYREWIDRIYDPTANKTSIISSRRERGFSSCPFVSFEREHF